MSVKSRLSCLCIALAFLLSAPQRTSAQVALTPNEKLVRQLMTELFINRDVVAATPYFGDPYIQHNPTIGDGHASLGGIIKRLPANFKVENGKVVEHWDVMQDDVPGDQTKSGHPMFTPGER